MTNLTEQIKKAIMEAYDKGIYSFGVRAMTGGESVRVGEYLDPSYHWEDGSATDEQMSGTSAIVFHVEFGEVDEDEFNAVIQKTIKTYGSGDEQIVIIAGQQDLDEVHNDESEIIIMDAKCIGVIK